MLFLDFETRSSIDLRKVGLYNYAWHPSTQILCTGWAVDDEPVKVERGFPPEVGALFALAPQVVAHNAAFEREILRAAGVETGWERWVDTAAMAAAMSLPRGLGEIAQALHLDAQKDAAGHRVMLKLSRPRKGWVREVGTAVDADGSNYPTFRTDPEFWEEEDKPWDFDALREYCRQDVAVMREVYRRLAPLSAQEARLWALTGRMNDRGVRVDLESLPRAQALLATASAEGEARFRVLTGGHGTKSYARAAPALGLPDMTKPTVRRALRNPDLPTPVLEALDIYRRLAKSSPAKLEAMKRRVSGDGRVRGSLVYYGAATGRWSGTGIQPQNFPRGLGENTDRFFWALQYGAVELLYAEPIATVAEALRGFLVGPFFVGDYSQIEARMLAWLAGQADLVQTFATHGDPYKEMARRIYGKQEVTKDERFMGKQAVLGCGYGMGWEKFARMLDEVYDVDISTDFAMRVVGTYREANKNIVRLWSHLETGMTTVLRRGEGTLKWGQLVVGLTEVGGVKYAFIELPSKRRLYYCEPELTGGGIEYWGRNIYTGGRWERVGTWGGKLTENVVQAMSRDVMAEAMLRLEDAGYPLVLTVHDEIVSEVHGLLPEFKRIMLQPPSWATGLPLDAEVFEAARYRK